MPHFVDDSFYPPKRPEDASFEEPSGNKINPTVAFFPCGGYVNDPTLSVHNLQRAAESKGAKFLFNTEAAAIRKEGTSGNQYKNGPVIGQLLCEIITACESGHDHDRYPVKVKLCNIDFNVNTGIFSRNRETIKGSTFSVLG